MLWSILLGQDWSLAAEKDHWVMRRAGAIVWRSLRHESYGLKRVGELTIVPSRGMIRVIDAQGVTRYQKDTCVYDPGEFRVQERYLVFTRWNYPVVAGTLSQPFSKKTYGPLLDMPAAVVVDLRTCKEVLSAGVRRVGVPVSVKRGFYYGRRAKDPIAELRHLWFHNWEPYTGPSILVKRKLSSRP